MSRIWRKRKQGTPNQVGKPFPVAQGQTEYEGRPMNVFGIRRRSDAEVEKMVEALKLEKATELYEQLMASPGFRYRPLHIRADYIAARIGLNPYEKVELINAMKKLEEGE